MLSNTGYKLIHEKKLTIGFFGGSITEARGQNSYRERLNTWFRESYPEAEVVSVSAAIGGTGTKLGMYRCDRDLNAHHPDLVFFEFAVNDCSEQYEAVAEQTETIFRKIRHANPYADIVVLFTTTKRVHDVLAAGGDYNSRTAQRVIAQHYDIPTVDMGEALRTRVLLEGGDFLRYTHDNVHPNDAGHAVYAECVVNWLESHLSVGSCMTAHEERPPHMSYIYDAHMTDASEMFENIDGFTYCAKDFCGRYYGYMEALVPGASATFSFTGENVSLYWMMAKDSGDLIVQIDEEEPFTVRSWDTYCLKFNRVGQASLGKKLSYGVHTIRLTVSETKSEQSEGTAIRIAAVMTA